jgi:putative exporter of polyketide antibiotics
MLVNVFVMVTLAAAGIAIGVASSSSDLVTPLAGSAVLGLYAAALVGIGHVAGGVLGTRFAAPVVVLVVLVTWFVQLVGPLLGLPDLVRNLALTAHFGQPMVGVWDWSGVVASLVIAAAGILLGTWGFQRRDMRA